MRLAHRVVMVTLAAATVVGCGLSSLPARAGYIVTLAQQGPDVVATGSGTIDLTGLTFRGPFGTTALMNPSAGTIITGPTASGTVDIYAGFVGPPRFGGGIGTFADTGSGSFAGIVSDLNFLIVPRGYMSGGPLADSSTYDNATFASLGVTPGTYEWTWGTGTNQNFRLDIVTAAVPEASSLTLLVLPLAFVMLLAARHCQAPAGSV